MNISTRIMVLMAALFISPTVMADDQYISKKSPYTVDKTLDRLENLLKNKGITIFKRVDHKAGAHQVGMKLYDSQLLIFGNPKMGTPLMAEQPMMGLDLPMKALAWKDPQGQVWLSYLNPSELKKRHHLKQDEILNKMSMALNNFTDKAVQKY